MVTHVERLRVRWVDTDASGRIHYTAAFRYFEIAEWELFRRVGVSLKEPDNELGFPRVEVKATFRAPLYVDDEIAVQVRPEKLGRTSITFVFDIFKGDSLAITGQVSCVFIGKDKRPIPIPDRIRHALLAG
jgi:YbgC/YbaW family acyl-CoA thioester hydrolase